MDADEFKKLITRKLGDKRGAQWRTAKELNIAQSNLSSMMRGRIAIPQKHIDALNALPDYAPPSGISQEILEYDGNHQLRTTFTARLTPKAYKLLDVVTRAHTPPHYHAPDLSANDDATSRFFEKLLESHHRALKEDVPHDLRLAYRQIEIDGVEAQKQFNTELKERRHLVADELTENEIHEDPLS